MKILKITEYAIEFDNGKDISFDHDQELGARMCAKTELNGSVQYR